MAKNSKEAPRMDFAPIDYDVTEIEPDAPEGEYKAVSGVKLSKTKKDSFPMLIIEWKIKSAADKKNKTAVGSQLSDFIAMFPKGDRRGNMGKLRLQQLFELLDVDADVMPKRIATKKDLDALIKALSKKEATIFVQHREGQDGETRANVLYKDPGGLGDEEEEEDEEDEDEDEGENEEESASDDDEDEDDDDSDEDDDDDDDDDEDEDEAPPAKKAAAKKTAAPAKKK